MCEVLLHGAAACQLVRRGDIGRPCRVLVHSGPVTDDVNEATAGGTHLLGAKAAESDHNADPRIERKGGPGAEPDVVSDGG